MLCDCMHACAHVWFACSHVDSSVVCGSFPKAQDKEAQRAAGQGMCACCCMRSHVRACVYAHVDVSVRVSTVSTRVDKMKARPGYKKTRRKCPSRWMLWEVQFRSNTRR